MEYKANCEQCRDRGCDSCMKETELEFCFNGIIAELQTWFKTGTDEQKEMLIESLRDCSDIINDEMPIINCEG